MVSVIGAIPGALWVAASTVNLDLGILGAIGGFITAITLAYVAVRRLGPQRKLTNAQADEIEDRVRRALSEEVEASLRRQREETARAQAAEAEAAAEVARLVADHARDRAEWKDERHQFINDLASRDKEVLVLHHNLSLARGEIEQLRSEVQTLRAALGVDPGRRRDDPATSTT